MTDYQRARYTLEADWYAQQAADQTERIIIDAINGRYDDLWLLVPCPVARQAIAHASETAHGDALEMRDLITNLEADDAANLEAIAALKLDRRDLETERDDLYGEIAELEVKVERQHDDIDRLIALLDANGIRWENT